MYLFQKSLRHLKSIFLWVLFSLLIFPSLTHAQSSCGTDEIHEFQMKTNSDYKRMYLQQNEAIQSIVQNKGNARQSEEETVYTIPVVVHVVHLGEDVGTGSNISDFQITEAIRGLNERYRNAIGDGADIRLEFCLASQDPSGQPTNGINRVDGSVVKNYQQYGIGGSCDGTSASETAIKNLSRWPVLKYYNIWVVHKICGGWAGYAYYPNGLAYDGAVMLRNYMTYGSTTLAHEIGHGFNLPHTFNGDNGNKFCPPNKNCATQGDYVCDTPPHKQNDCGASNPCTSEGIWDNSRFNYMSYCSKKTRFTQGQKDRIRASLNVYPRANLLNSSGCNVLIDNAIVLKDILNLSETVCNSNQLEPIIRVENIGNNVIDSFRITYTLNGENENTIAWIGAILPNKEVSIQLPKLKEIVGENTLEVSISLPNGEEGIGDPRTRSINFNYDPSACFVTVWQSDHTGASNNNQIIFPGQSNSSFDAYWEELNNTSNWGVATVSGSRNTLTFSQAGTYRISVAPKENGLHSIQMNISGDEFKIVDVEQWGKIDWSSFSSSFSGCKNLIVSASDAPVLTNVTDMSGMFAWTESFNQPINHWKVGHVTNMTGLFYGAQSFNQPLRDWEVNNVTNMDGMFYGAVSFSQPLADWDVSKVANMAGMFSEAKSFNQPLADWGVSNVSNMKSMFLGAASFNQPLGNWDVGNVSDMSGMFYEAKSFNQPLADWNVSNVIDMTGLFYGAQSFNQILADWNVSNVALMKGMFGRAASFNQPLGNWNVRKVSDMEFMFLEATSFNQSLGNWTLKDKVNMSHMLSLSGMDCQNYNETLTSWAAQPLTPDNLSLGAEGVEYGIDGVEARNILVSKGWTINDSGLDSACGCEVFETHHDVSICSGQDYILPNGDQVSVAGIYLDTLITSAGCDSIITTHLTVWPLPDKPVISTAGTTLSTNYTNGNQWYLNGVAIDGAHHQSIEISETGIYFVVHTDTNGCRAISEELEVLTVAVNEKQAGIEAFRIYPNPNVGFFNIELATINGGDATLKVVNILGQVVSSQPLKGLLGKRIIPTDLSEQGKGVYFINLYYNNVVINRRVVVQ